MRLHVGSQVVKYTAYVAPGLLASSAMNGAIFDSTFNIYFKLKIAHTYDAVLSTPLGVGDLALGEVTWALMRGSFYSGSFLVVMAALGYVLSTVGDPLLPRRDADQLRLRRHGHGGYVLHAQLAGLRHGVAGDPAAVPVLCDLLSAHRLPGVASGGGAGAHRCTRGWRLSAGSTPGCSPGRSSDTSYTCAAMGITGMAITAREARQAPAAMTGCRP